MTFNPFTGTLELGGTSSSIVTPKVLHVTTAGNDATGDGSLANPYQTGAKAFTVALALAGQNICIQFGVGAFNCTTTEIWPERIAVRGMGPSHSSLSLATTDHVYLNSDLSIDVLITASSPGETGQAGPNIQLTRVWSTAVQTAGAQGTVGADGANGDSVIPGGPGGDGGNGGLGGNIGLIECWIVACETVGGPGGNGGNGGADNGAGAGAAGNTGFIGSRGGAQILRSHVETLYCATYDMGGSNIVAVNDGYVGTDYGGNSNMPQP